MTTMTIIRNECNAALTYRKKERMTASNQWNRRAGIQSTRKINVASSARGVGGCVRWSERYGLIPRPNYYNASSRYRETRMTAFTCGFVDFYFLFFFHFLFLFVFIDFYSPPPCRRRPLRYCCWLRVYQLRVSPTHRVQRRGWIPPTRCATLWPFWRQYTRAVRAVESKTYRFAQRPGGGCGGKLEKNKTIHRLTWCRVFYRLGCARCMDRTGRRTQ